MAQKQDQGISKMEMMHEGQKIFNYDNCKMIFDQKHQLLDHTRGKDQCKPKDYKHLQKQKVNYFALFGYSVISVDWLYG